VRIIESASKEWEGGRGYRKRVLVPESMLEEGVFVQQVSYAKGESMPAHHHERLTEVFYPLSEGNMEINGESLRIVPGTIIVCEPGDVHGIECVEEDFSILVIKVNSRPDDMIWD
jgi:quercetin dioxygenase-like cupin family protein